MIHTVGTDLVDLERLERVIRASPTRFKSRVLTDAELAYCESLNQPLPSIGARFAAKEAVMKCLQSGWTGGISWKDIEVTRTDAGVPGIRLAGRAAEIATERGILKIHLSLSHTARHAIAMAVAEKQDLGPGPS